MVYANHHTFLFFGVIATSYISLPVPVDDDDDDDGGGGLFFLFYFILSLLPPSSCCRTSIPVMFRSVLEFFKSTIARLPRRCSSTQKYAASQLCSDARILNMSVDIQ